MNVENNSSVYPELTTIKVVHNGIARRVKIRYDMKWDEFEAKICRLFSISPPLVTCYKDSMGVSVIVDSDDDFYFFLDEEFNGRLEIIPNAESGDGIGWTVVRNEDKTFGEAENEDNQVNEQTLSSIPPSSLAPSSPAPSMHRDAFGAALNDINEADNQTNTGLENRYINNDHSQTNPPTPLNPNEDKDMTPLVDNSSPSNEQVSEDVDQSTPGNDKSSEHKIIDEGFEPADDKGSDDSVAKSVKSDTSQDILSANDSSKNIDQSDISQVSHIEDASRDDIKEGQDNSSSNLNPSDTPLEKSDSESKPYKEETILFETTFPETMEKTPSTNSEVLAKEPEFFEATEEIAEVENKDSINESNNPIPESHDQAFINPAPIEACYVSNCFPNTEAKSLIESESENESFPPVPTYIPDIDNVTVESIPDIDTKSLKSSTPKEPEAELPIDCEITDQEAENQNMNINDTNASTANIDPITFKVQRLRSVCHEADKKLQNIPASLLIIELFSDQIFNGVRIDLDLFEQAISRIANGDRSKEPPTSAEQAANEVLRNMKTLFVHLGSSMAEFIEQDLVPFIKTNVDSKNWMKSNLSDDGANSSNNNNSSAESAKGGCSSNANNNQECSNDDHFGRFNYLRQFGLPSPFLRAKHKGKCMRKNHEYHQTSSRYGCHTKRNRENCPTETVYLGEAFNSVDSSPPKPTFAESGVGSKGSVNEANEVLKEILINDETQNKKIPNTGDNISTHVEETENSTKDEQIEDHNSECKTESSHFEQNQRLSSIDDQNLTESVYNHLFPMKELFKLPLTLMNGGNSPTFMNPFQKEASPSHEISNNEINNSEFCNNMPGSFEDTSNEYYPTFNEYQVPVNPFSDEFAIRPPKPKEYQRISTEEVEETELNSIRVDSDDTINKNYPPISGNSSDDGNESKKDIAEDIKPEDVQLIFGLNTLREMGFPNDFKNLEALQECNLEVESAVEHLLRNI
ncbi:hypothetical protein K502DRAFT_329286 [Neoconidiobolus thromboides FSU 785]|nr:hypothetical protein K502DRAFT_329286 [Neoconidiobolus thromboides FSU 785]